MAPYEVSRTSTNKKRCSQGRTAPLLILFHTIKTSIVLASLKLGNTYTVNDAKAFSYTYICCQFSLEPDDFLLIYHIWTAYCWHMSSLEVLSLELKLLLTLPISKTSGQKAPWRIRHTFYAHPAFPRTSISGTSVKESHGLALEPPDHISKD